MNTEIVQIACPNCRSTVVFSFIGNVFETPLICQTCKQAFSPHFYCPDAASSARHVFAAAKFYVDNAGQVYAFCPEHTFTTYALAADSQPRQKRASFRRLTRLLDSLVFRAALTIEGWRWRLASRRR
jgi:hypothetical protein